MGSFIASLPCPEPVSFGVGMLLRLMTDELPIAKLYTTKSPLQHFEPFFHSSASFRGFVCAYCERETADNSLPQLHDTSVFHHPIATGAPSPLHLSRPKVSVVIYDNDGGCYRTCAPGTWASLSDGSYECASCNPGYYCAGGCADPVPCPAGTSRSAFGAVVENDCAACLPGYYALETGSDSCFPCDAGYSCSSATAAPVACLAGTYSSAAATDCTDCSDGFYNALEAQESCQPCPAGHECPSKASEPTPCSSGSYSSGSQTACEECQAGYFCSSTGSSPAPCTEGSYSLANMAYCVSCPPGAFCLNTDQVCAGLPPHTHIINGFYSPFVGREAQLPIPTDYCCASRAVLLDA